MREQRVRCGGKHNSGKVKGKDEEEEEEADEI